MFFINFKIINLNKTKQKESSKFYKIFYFMLLNGFKNYSVNIIFN